MSCVHCVEIAESLGQAVREATSTSEKVDALFMNCFPVAFASIRQHGGDALEKHIAQVAKRLEDFCCDPLVLEAKWLQKLDLIACEDTGSATFDDSIFDAKLNEYLVQALFRLQLFCFVTCALNPQPLKLMDAFGKQSPTNDTCHSQASFQELPDLAEQHQELTQDDSQDACSSLTQESSSTLVRSATLPYNGPDGSDDSAKPFTCGRSSSSSSDSICFYDVDQKDWRHCDPSPDVHTVTTMLEKVSHIADPTVPNGWASLLSRRLGIFARILPETIFVIFDYFELDPIPFSTVDRLLTHRTFDRRQSRLKKRRKQMRMEVRKEQRERDRMKNTDSSPKNLDADGFGERPCKAVMAGCDMGDTPLSELEKSGSLTLSSIKQNMLSMTNRHDSVTARTRKVNTSGTRVVADSRPASNRPVNKPRLMQKSKRPRTTDPLAAKASILMMATNEDSNDSWSTSTSSLFHNVMSSSLPLSSSVVELFPSIQPTPPSTSAFHFPACSKKAPARNIFSEHSTTLVGRDVTAVCQTPPRKGCTGWDDVAETPDKCCQNSSPVDYHRVGALFGDSRTGDGVDSPSNSCVGVVSPGAP